MRAEVILSKYIKGIIDRDYRGYENGMKALDYYTVPLRTALKAMREIAKITRQECGVTGNSKQQTKGRKKGK